MTFRVADGGQTRATLSSRGRSSRPRQSTTGLRSDASSATLTGTSSSSAKHSSEGRAAKNSAPHRVQAFSDIQLRSCAPRLRGIAKVSHVVYADLVARVYDDLDSVAAHCSILPREFPGVRSTKAQRHVSDVARHG